MSTLGTGTLGSGTLGNPGTVAPGGGGTVSVTLPRLRRPPRKPPAGSGHLHVTVHLSGVGQIRAGAQLDPTLSGQGQFVSAEETKRRAALRRDDAEVLALILDLPELLP